MNFFDLVRQRQSVRDYLPRPVEREKIERCLEAARLAPSACNSQPWKFIVVDDPQLKNTIAQESFGKLISFNHFTMEAPVLIIIISEPSNFIARIGGIIKSKQYQHFDIGIAAEHLCLQATEEGLGSCILGWFAEKSLKKLLHIPHQKRIDLVITLGYPANTEIRTKNRKSLAEIVSYNQFR